MLTKLQKMHTIDCLNLGDHNRYLLGDAVCIFRVSACKIFAFQFQREAFFIILKPKTDADTQSDVSNLYEAGDIYRDVWIALTTFCVHNNLSEGFNILERNPTRMAINVIMRVIAVTITTMCNAVACFTSALQVIK